MEFRDSHPFSTLAGLPQTRPSLRRVSSSVLHVCGAKIAKNYQMQHLNKVVGIENNSYLCTVTIKWDRDMPEIFRFFGFSFFFYSKEHEPVHVHVEGNSGMAKFVWNGSEFTLLVKEKIKANDLKKIKAVIDENADLIIKRWEEHFNS